jgi:hypothetical protein
MLIFRIISVYVEIDASKLLVKEFDLQCPNGMIITISTEYEWLPSQYSSCNAFKHNLAKKKKGVDGTTSEYMQTQLQWQEVGKRKKDNKKTVPSSSSTVQGTQVLNEEENQELSK